MNSQIKAIGFDYGGVIHGKPGSYFDEQVSKLLDMTSEEFHQEYLKVNSQVNNGLIPKDVFWKEFLKSLGKFDKYEKTEKLISTIQEQKTINTEILDLVDSLKSNGYKVGLLSNNSIDAREKFEENGVVNHFDITIISAEVGLSKPDPKIFELFTSQLEVSVQELLYIDDSVNSLSTAGEVGFTPILYTDYDTLLIHLNQIEVI